MAKKLDVDIDPGKFLDSFRPEMPAPASPGSLGTDGNTSAKEARLAEKPKAKVGKGCHGKGRGIPGTLPPCTENPRVFGQDRLHPQKLPRADTAYRAGHREERGLTLSVYVDRVLEQHFREYEEVIRRLYKKNYEDIY